MKDDQKDAIRYALTDIEGAVRYWTEKKDRNPIEDLTIEEGEFLQAFRGTLKDLQVAFPKIAEDFWKEARNAE